MEFRFRATDERPPAYVPSHSSSSNVSYFTEQALRAGFSGPFRNSTENFRNPNPMHTMYDAVRWEFEKEQIREEIIAFEMARRRVQEEEVRREMMAGQMALSRGGGGGSVFSVIEPRASHLQHQSEGRSFEERVMTAIEERLRDSGRRSRIGGGFEEVPFQRIAEPRITEVKSTSEVCKEKVIFLAKPEGNSSGAKRKAVTPPVAPPSVGSKKKRKEEWSCALCQVTATSEQGLNEHLRGKKHKSKEAGLGAQKAGKNYTIGLFPKKIDKPIKLVEPSTNKELKEPNSEDVKPNNDMALVAFRSNSGLKNQKGDSSEKMQENGGDFKEKKNKKSFKFWCEMCQVGAFSEKVMNKHKKGKKHLGHLQRLEKKDKSEVVTKVNEAPQKESDPTVGPKNNEETPDNESLEGSAYGEVEVKQDTASD